MVCWKDKWLLVYSKFDTKECSITIGAHKDEEHKSLVQLLRGEGIYKKESITAKNTTVTIRYKIPFLTSSNKKKV